MSSFEIVVAFILIATLALLIALRPVDKVPTLNPQKRK